MDMKQLYAVERIPIKVKRVPIKIERVPIKIERVPIKIKRVPIKLNKKERKSKLRLGCKKYEGLSKTELKHLENLSKLGQEYVDQRLKQIQKNAKTEYTDLELQCIEEFVPYYENLICSVTGNTQFELLDNVVNKKLSKKWKPVMKCFQMCIDKGYNWKIYLDAQFDAYKGWKEHSTISYPMPNMLYSERAIKAYENYIYHNETAYQNEGYNTKLHAKNTGNYTEELKKRLESDINQLDIAVKYSVRKLKYIDKTRPDVDRVYYTVALDYTYENLSVECWTMIPEMDEFIHTIKGRSAILDKKISDYTELIQNTTKMNIITQMWKSFNIPQFYGIISIWKDLGLE